MEVCQAKAWLLLMCFEGTPPLAGDMHGPLTVRAVLTSDQCEHISGDGSAAARRTETALREMRKSYEDRIERRYEGGVERIKALEVSDELHQIADQTVFHYWSYTPVWCRTALTPRNRLYYDTVFRAQRWLYKLGVPVTMLKDYKFALDFRHRFTLPAGRNFAPVH